ncbi:c-type cytochrome [Aquibacillus sp. 3ASR75-11]|uniref:Menaquinol:cytochrome c reductase cytochrome c subunit n=1 Tax=Terrihalobacillus insolitus TaxID=2950438 RepID=A0A9X4AM02_9BACI|nr:menaquinol-cytochrome c reductase cytochrome b/c subunit [Terrihalobacillus insolitus]MDC3413039.1 c-type cytochrome [Terrihalobacillus insolitus]MDC3424781.1 c-type cytochrome [Terrihalobacillus insolitus]
MHKGKGMKFVGDSRIKADRQPNIPKDYSEYPGRTEAFWPNFLLKEWLVGAVFLVGFLVMTLAEPAPLEKMADPTDTTYIPLPDWYFLFLYQFLKYEFAGGNYVLIGAIVAPGLAFGALLLAPFLDKGSQRRPVKRPITTGIMLLAITSVIWLTYESVAEVDWETRTEQNKPVLQPEVEIDKESDGYAVFNKSCVSCHGDNLQGGVGPTLIGVDYSVEEIKKIAVEGTGDMPSGQFKGSDEELQQLAEFIVSVNEQADE